MLAIGTYYIERSYRYSPCWDIATSKKEAIQKAKNWTIQDNCLCSISKGDRKILFTDYTGDIHNKVINCKM